MPSRRSPELLAPAGDHDCLRAAIENGADAVYFGLATGFNARARAANFEATELPAVLDQLHRRGVKGYVTLNTLVFSDELAEFESTVRRVAEAGVDAVLVQDLGAARLIREIAPGLPIHASTQMTLTSAESIAVAESLGIERVVLARELSIDEIRKIHARARVELEVFVHGALCVAYSGQCLTSESLGGRSANRGQCAQACRLPYDLLCDDKLVELDQVKYLLSPHDLAAYDLTPELIAAGVSCFKIEGRLKTAEYVANITRHYRTAIDTAMAGRPVEFSPREVEEMELSFSRGFSHGWLEGCDHKALVEGTSSNKRGVLLGKVIGVRGDRVELDLVASVKRGDGVVFDCGKPTDDSLGGRVYDVLVKGHSASEAISAGRAELAFAHGSLDPAAIWPGQEVWKNDDPELRRRLRASYQGERPHRQTPLDLAIRAEVGQPLRVTATTATGATCELDSGQPLEEARKHVLDEAMLREQLGRLGGTPFELRSLTASIEGRPMIPLSVLGKVRHAMVAELETASVAGRSHAVADSPVLPILRDESRDSCAVHLAALGLQTSEAAGPETLQKQDATAARARRGESHGKPVVDRALHRPFKPVTYLHVLCRTLDQLDEVLAAGERDVYVDFADIRQYRDAVNISHSAGATIALATPRIQKPDELGIFRVIDRYEPDAILVRNLAGLNFFTEAGRAAIADFSLNAANEITVGWLLEQGAERVTAPYDLNREQLQGLVESVAPAVLEVVAHQHMPMFHMEHCVFCAVLSPGTNKTNCGRPCDVHQVRLRDRLGVEHPLTADVGCRNTLFNAVPQSGAEVVPSLLKQGVVHYRVELLDERGDDLRKILRLYRDLLAGRISANSVWTQLRAANRVGVTRGTLEERRNPLALL